MGVLEEVQSLKQQGMQDQQIQQSLQGQGYTTDQINEAMSNSNIKSAVTNPSDIQAAFPGAPGEAPQPGQQAPMPGQPSAPAPGQIQEAPQGFGEPNPQGAPPTPMPQGQSLTQEMPAGQGGMMPSLMSQAPSPGQEQMPGQGGPAMTQEYGDGYSDPQDPYYSQGGYEDQGYQAGISAETISEIADQAVGEKITQMRNKLESVNKFKTTAETKLDVLDDRLKRLEKIIDRLQLSILQKVGEQMTNIEDIKKELVETQKSFSAAKKTHHTVHHNAPRIHSSAKTTKKKAVKKKAKRKSTRKKKDDIFDF